MVVVRDAGDFDGGWGCFMYGFLPSSAVSGVVSFIMAVEALTASL